MLRGALAVLVMALAVASAGAQQEVRSSSQAYKLAPLLITTATNRVAVDVVVRQTNGQVVSGLARSDFQVLDNGHARPLTGFFVVKGPQPPPPTAAAQPAPTAATVSSAAAAPPRSVALFFDDVNTDKGDLVHARHAAQRFVTEALGPNDRVAIFTASDRQSLGFTHNKSKLLATIARLTVHPRHDRRFGTCPHITPFQAYQIIRIQGGMALKAAIAEKQACDEQDGVENNDGTEAYTGNNGIPGFDNQSFQIMADAQTIWEETRAASHDTLASIGDVVDYLARQPGRRMLLLASGGFLSSTLGNLRQNVIDQALRSGVVINSLDARGLYTEGPGRGISYVGDLPKLPLPTYFYEESSHLGAQMAQEEAMADLAESTGGLFFHNNNDLTVGFDRLGLIPSITYELTFAPGDIAHDGKFHKIKVDLTPKAKDIIQARPGYYAPLPDSGTTLQDRLDAAMHTSAPENGLAATVSRQAERGAVRVNVHFDATRLPFARQHGRRHLDLIFIAGLFNPQGKFITGKRAEMDMALKDQTWEYLLAHGLNINLTLKAAAGTYTLRLVVGNPGGQIFANSQPAVAN